MNGIELIAAERQRQIDVEGWTPEHDDQWTGEQLASVACLYAMTLEDRNTEFRFDMVEFMWPLAWDFNWWKPTPGNRIKELTKAGALIAAEIDRLQRRAKPTIEKGD